jgi:hypothetical protein
MASTPVRLSAALAARAREAARVQDRSVTEQVEHWARLGELVEAAVSGSAVLQLKRTSYDERLHERLADADTPAGRQRTSRLVRNRGGTLHGVAPEDSSAIVRHDAGDSRKRSTQRRKK